MKPPARQTSAKLFVGSPCCCCTGGSCRTGTTFSPEEERSCKRVVLLTVTMRAMVVMMILPNNKCSLSLHPPEHAHFWYEVEVDRWNPAAFFNRGLSGLCRKYCPVKFSWQRTYGAAHPQARLSVENIFCIDCFELRLEIIRSSSVTFFIPNFIIFCQWCTLLFWISQHFTTLFA